MKYEEYLLKLEELKIEFRNKKEELMQEFVRANNPYKIGDKVTDHLGTIIIDRIGFAWNYNKPCAVYAGLVLKKDGTPTKKELRRRVWQVNIK